MPPDKNGKALLTKYAAGWLGCVCVCLNGEMRKKKRFEEESIRAEEILI